MVSDAKRRANDKWDAAHSFRFSVKVGREEADAFKVACKRRGITPHSFFLSAVRGLIAEDANADATTPTGDDADDGAGDAPPSGSPSAGSGA